jgi:hypothetical protein
LTAPITADRCRFLFGGIPMTPYEFRLQLLKAGFSPLPLNGKRPVQENWQTRDCTNPHEIRLWSTMWHSAQNTGVLTRLTPALDIDITDPDAAEAIEQLVCDRFGEPCSTTSMPDAATTATS